MFDLQAALRRVIETEGSDLHLKVPSRPLIRTHGDLEPIPGSEPLSPEETEGVFREMLKEEPKLREFGEENEVDFSYAVPGLARFRVNAFRQRGVISLVCRAIPHTIRTVEELSASARDRRAGPGGARDHPRDRAPPAPASPRRWPR